MQLPQITADQAATLINQGGGGALGQMSNGLFALQSPDENVQRSFDGAVLPGRIYARAEDGQVIEVEDAGDLPAGAHFLLTDREQNYVSHGIRKPDGQLFLTGSDPTASSVIGDSLLDMTGTMVEAGYGGAAVLARGGHRLFGGDDPLAGDEQRREALRIRKAIEDNTATNPEILGFRERGENDGRSFAGTVAGSAVFLAPIRASAFIGGRVGSAIDKMLNAKGIQIVDDNFNEALFSGGFAGITNAFINYGITVSDISDVLTDMGVPPERQLPIMRDAAFWPALVSGLTGSALGIGISNRRAARQRPDSSGAIFEGLTETAEELTQAETTRRYAGVQYDPFDVGMQAFLAGALSQGSFDFVGESIGRLRQYPELLRLRSEIRRVQNVTDSFAAVTQSARYDGDKKFAKALEHFGKWRQRTEEVRQMADHEISVNFGKFFGDNRYTPEQIKKTVLQAIDAMSSLDNLQTRPAQTLAKVVGLAEDSSDLGDEARSFLDRTSRVLGVDENAPFSDKAEKVENFLQDADKVWSEYRLREVFQRGLGLRDEDMPFNLYEMLADYASNPEKIEEVVRRAPDLARELRRTVKQGVKLLSIDDEETKKLIADLSGGQPTEALQKLGLLNTDVAIARAARENDFGRWWAEKTGRADVVKAYDALTKPSADPELHRRRIADAREADSQEQAAAQAGKIAGDGTAAAIPLTPASKNTKKAYEKTLDIFAKEAREREDAQTVIAGFIGGSESARGRYALARDRWNDDDRQLSAEFDANINLGGAQMMWLERAEETIAALSDAASDGVNLVPPPELPTPWRRRLEEGIAARREEIEEQRAADEAAAAEAAAAAAAAAAEPEPSEQPQPSPSSDADVEVNNIEDALAGLREAIEKNLPEGRKKSALAKVKNHGDKLREFYGNEKPSAENFTKAVEALFSLRNLARETKAETEYWFNAYYDSLKDKIKESGYKVVDDLVGKEYGANSPVVAVNLSEFHGVDDLTISAVISPAIIDTETNKPLVLAKVVVEKSGGEKPATPAAPEPAPEPEPAPSPEPAPAPAPEDTTPDTQVSQTDKRLVAGLDVLHGMLERQISRQQRDATEDDKKQLTEMQSLLFKGNQFIDGKGNINEIMLMTMGAWLARIAAETKAISVAPEHRANPQFQDARKAVMNFYKVGDEAVLDGALDAWVKSGVLRLRPKNSTIIPVIRGDVGKAWGMKWREIGGKMYPEMNAQITTDEPSVTDTSFEASDTPAPPNNTQCRAV